MRLSVLDLVPVRTDQTTSDALAATARLAKIADQLGFHRYWVAEHHNIPSIAATSPAVLIGLLAAQTARIRLGSGGVMLPNHAPLAVAEQFALLEAAYPGRIDLGVGRAAGSDLVTSTVLRGSTGDSGLDHFGDHVDDLIGFLDPAGLTVQLADGGYLLRATPAATGAPRVFMLGSSLHSAQLAAAKGLPYVFGYHLFGRGAEEALALYRAEFTPSRVAAEPVALLTVNVVVAETRAEATDLALPDAQFWARQATGQPLRPLDLVHDARAAQTAALTAQQRELVDAALQRAVLGTATEAAAQLRDLADRFGVDELMVNPVASAHRGVDPKTAPGRETTLELLAGGLPQP
ncbi:LLM class flavin-dependent oxidoreductase [Mycobacterium sp. M1]|uniref:LLM class flavin-dependent oxidoreductase n=1 Tax=Mycolicibacter acidiphilus TaxID=2835306 RepID=A0ABS5RDR8_9MYCO|nr:LLM class flavin-dependent oxidoreductase [Mycolicibacter acidiphilus]MBS9532428.1 LLM class flavin-dependent oxidoreductase [Mycolicibacter acidiphilus]